MLVVIPVFDNVKRIISLQIVIRMWSCEVNLREILALLSV